MSETRDQVTVSVKLTTMLAKYGPASAATNPFPIELPAGSTVGDLIDRLGIPRPLAKLLARGSHCSASHEPITPMTKIEGIVCSVLGGACNIEWQGKEIACDIRGRLKEGSRRESHPVAVGDAVVAEAAPDGRGAIEEVMPRRSKLSRPGKNDRDIEQVIVANADQLMVITSVRKPQPKPGLIDRYMIAAENGRLDAMLVINKVDLAKDSQHEELRDIYQSAGYAVILTSATKREGLDGIQAALAGKFTVLAGQSGVGKSSLINAIEPSLDLRVDRVSKATNKGRHATTRVTRHPLSCGGWVADTPGIREFGLWDVLPEEIDGCFPEMVEAVEDCKFPGCTHRHEPDCAVLAAVEEGRIHTSRYESYVRIREHLEAKRDYRGRTM